MLTNEFLEAFADYYGEFTLDELSDRLGVTPFELIAYAEDLIDENYDDFAEEMEYNEEQDDDDEE